ncbi:hypothetical protein DPMN_164040 [Dreissena polymorpha]|uniref:Uncharacterized protein n=1 Tax=Dreissena polymorpha TaxID=45954 RepID=A0A9D4IV04_DREPO|nr:hypothetical protein DPMN_164040 [Dreissena polymorpha]
MTRLCDFPDPSAFAHLRGTNIMVINVNARVFTNQEWTGRQRTKTNTKTSPEQSAIFQLVQEINKTNAKYVTSIVKTAPPPWQPYIYKTNLFTKFHDDWAKNVTSRVKLPPPGSHVIQLTGTIFELCSHIKETNVLTKFHGNWDKNVTSRVEKCPAHWRPYINKTNVLTNFHDDWAKIVTSRPNKKNCPPIGGHVFQLTGTTFELNQHIIKTNILTNLELDRDFIGTKLLTKFHEDLFTNKYERTDGQMTDQDRPQKLT